MDDIVALVERGNHEGCWFPRNPLNPNGVQVRLHRSATAEGHAIAAALRERQAETNEYFASHRPAWPTIPDDGYGPRLDPDEPDATIFQIRLAAILFEDELATAIEEMVAHAQQQIAEIVEQAVAARQSATLPSASRPAARRRKPETADRVVFE